MKKCIVVLGLLLAAGCSDIDKRYTDFKALKDCDKGYDCFEFTAHASSGFFSKYGLNTYSFHSDDLNDPNAENFRMKLLQMWLSDNGYSDTKYEIVFRKPVATAKYSYDIYYTVKVPCKTNP